MTFDPKEFTYQDDFNQENIDDDLCLPYIKDLLDQPKGRYLCFLEFKDYLGDIHDLFMRLDDKETLTHIVNYIFNVDKYYFGDIYLYDLETNEKDYILRDKRCHACSF